MKNPPLGRDNVFLIIDLNSLLHMMQKPIHKFGQELDK